jgi:hypothetical protein
MYHVSVSSSRHAGDDDGEQGMHCHAAKKKEQQPSSGCAVSASCNPSTQMSLFAPAPRAVVVASVSLEAPSIARAALRNVVSNLLPGFTPRPLNPPRPVA